MPPDKQLDCLRRLTNDPAQLRDLTTGRPYLLGEKQPLDTHKRRGHEDTQL